MSDAQEVATNVANDVVEEIDVGALLTGDDDVVDDIDSESLGRSVGETLGETLGRILGRGLVDWILSKLTFWDDEDPSFGARLAKSLLVAVGRTLRKPEFKEPLGDALRGMVEQLEERQQAAKDAAAEASDEATEAAADAAESATDAASDAKESAEEASGAASEKADEAVEALESDQMDELRKETYRELLEMMDYSKLQSIAKESGVKANQQREEMIDAIVEQFDAEGADGDSDGDGSDGDGDGDDAAEADDADGDEG